MRHFTNHYSYACYYCIFALLALLAAEQYRIVQNFTIQFDFRTTQQDVVIVSTSGMNGALAVDMHEGKVTNWFSSNRLVTVALYPVRDPRTLGTRWTHSLRCLVYQFDLVVEAICLSGSVSETVIMSPVAVGCQTYFWCFIGVIDGLTTVYKLYSFLHLVIKSETEIEDLNR